MNMEVVVFYAVSSLFVKVSIEYILFNSALKYDIVHGCIYYTILMIFLTKFSLITTIFGSVFIEFFVQLLIIALNIDNS